MTLSIFKPSEALTFATVEAERLRFIAHCQAKKSAQDDSLNIEMQLQQVLQCDSAGLAFLIETKKIAQQHGLEVQMHPMPASAAALADFYGLRTFLEHKEND